MTVALATALLAEQRRDLEAAIAVLSTTAIGRLSLSESQRLLRKVASFERDMARAPDQFAGQTLCFMGENGDAPLIRSLCRDAPTLAGVVASATSIAA